MTSRTTCSWRGRVLNGLALLTVEVPGLDVVTASLAAADDLIAATAPEVATTGLAIKATGDGLQGHWGDLAGDALYLGASRVGGKGKQEGEDLPPGAMAAQDANAGASAGRTVPSRAPDPTAVPRGRRTVINPDNDADTIRALTAENKGAATLAQNGYDVEQNPNIPGPKNPDYRVEGRTVDALAPVTSRPRNIWDRIREKVDDGQTDRVNLILDDTTVDREALRKQLTDWPIPGLKEIIVTDHGTIDHITF